MDRVYIPVILLHISIVAEKYSTKTISQLRRLELLTVKAPLLHMFYYMNWLTHDLWTRTGGWEFDRSHGAGTSSQSHWQQVEEQAPKHVCWALQTNYFDPTPGIPKNTTQHQDVSFQFTLDRRPMYYSQQKDPSSPNVNLIMWTHTSLEINIKLKIK